MNNVKDKKKKDEEFDSVFLNQFLNVTSPPRLIKPSKKNWKVKDLIAGRYKIFQIKKGGMGIVYLCHDNKACEPVAIKTYIEREEDYRETIERFRSEALTWVKLGKHRNIVQAKYVLNIENKPYVFMEYMPSEDENSPSLRNLLKKGRLDHDRCLNFAVQFCDGMIHAASVIPGMIHRDIKPENILITPDGVLKISDFGLTKVFYSMSDLGSFEGTVPYASPEQCLGLAMMDISSDIYSFGVVLYEMLTGTHPFIVNGYEKEKEIIIEHLLKIPEDPKKMDSSIPGGLADIIMKCLNKRPENRYRNFKELKANILRYYSIPVKPVDTETVSPNFEALEAQYFINKGISMTTLGRYHEAISLFDLALKTDPKLIEALSRKGIALISIGKYNEASDYFDKYLSVNPFDADVLNHKGSLLNLQGNREEALEYFDKALDTHPWCNEVLYNKAVTLFIMGRYEEAYESLNKIEKESIGKSVCILTETCLQEGDIIGTEENGNISNRGPTKNKI